MSAFTIAPACAKPTHSYPHPSQSTIMITNTDISQATTENPLTSATTHVSAYHQGGKSIPVGQLLEHISDLTSHLPGEHLVGIEQYGQKAELKGPEGAGFATLKLVRQGTAGLSDGAVGWKGKPSRAGANTTFTFDVTVQTRNTIVAEVGATLDMLVVADGEKGLEKSVQCYYPFSHELPDGRQAMTTKVFFCPVQKLRLRAEFSEAELPDVLLNCCESVKT